MEGAAGGGVPSPTQRKKRRSRGGSTFGDPGGQKRGARAGPQVGSRAGVSPWAQGDGAERVAAGGVAGWRNVFSRLGAQSVLLTQS